MGLAGRVFLRLDFIPEFVLGVELKRREVLSLFFCQILHGFKAGTEAVIGHIDGVSGLDTHTSAQFDQRKNHVPELMFFGAFIAASLGVKQFQPFRLNLALDVFLLIPGKANLSRLAVQTIGLGQRGRPVGTEDRIPSSFSPVAAFSAFLISAQALVNSA